MSYKEKLIKLLKTVPEVKEQMEKLKFWCKVNYLLSDWSTDIWIYCFQLWLKMFLTDSWLEVENSNILEIIWLPLQERFIRIFCKKNNIRFSIHTSYYWLDDVLNFSAVYIEWNEYCQIDNTKDFNNQTDEVYQKIYEVLYNLKRKLVVGVLIEN